MNLEVVARCFRTGFMKRWTYGFESTRYLAEMHPPDTVRLREGEYLHSNAFRNRRQLMTPATVTTTERRCRASVPVVGARRRARQSSPTCATLAGSSVGMCW